MRSAEPVRVLLIDVGSGRVKHLEPMLQAAGLRTFLAQECSELLAEARQGHFDLVLVDAELTEVDQTDLPTIIRSINCAQYLPIVWLADDTNPTTTSAALELGIDLVLNHSRPLSVILSYILALSRRKRRTDELFKTIDQLRNLLAEQAEHLNRLKSDNSQLRELSIRDPLTKVHNARYMHQWLSQAFAYANRYNKPLSVLLIDIDHFKWINDCYGHLTGDETLKRLAEMLRSTGRDSDLVARYGGDEFLLALPETPAVKLAGLARRILRDVKEISIGSGQAKTTLSCSLGSATYPSDGDVRTYEDLIMRADQALYAAKRTGRGQLAQWSDLSPLHQQAVEALATK